MKNKLLTTAFLTAFLASPAAFSADTPADKNADTYRLLALFGDVFEKVRKDYVEEVTDKKLVESAINGMLSSLDPHSGYLNDDSFKDMQVQTKGEFGGLGIEVTMDSGWVKVVSPIDDTPAHKAGIKPGDYITHIDGTAVMGLSLNEAVDKMRGKPGTDIKLTIRRKANPDAIDFTLTRAIIKIKPVRYEVREDDKVGYIRINTFSEKTTESVKKAVKDISKGLDGKPIGYIIDLRNNPGGLLDQAVAVSDLFLESGEIVSTRSRNPEDTMRFNAKPGDIADNLPIVVLINDGSASASEIVAGALQDHKRAVIAGTKSFGKGSVQTIIPIVNHGAIRITTARYYTPSGVSIQAKGIEPDIEIKPAKLEEIAYNDIRSESELPKALSNDSQPKNKSAKNKKAKDAFTKFDQPAPQDYQLDRAIDILKGISVYQKPTDK
ncbi:MAG: S41 family peptidase [Alphaproteobacteria bacterium]|nr:S41 family peptidase [Alphaproteobacteria bacterium]